VLLVLLSAVHIFTDERWCSRLRHDPMLVGQFAVLKSEIVSSAFHAGKIRRR
jgi:hypothetical protein